MAFPDVSPGTVRFGVYEADLRAGELRKSGVKIRIQEMPFRALTLLLSRHGEVVSREELRQALWPDGVNVDFDQGINSAIRRLRDALGDSAENPIFIETVERRGYRWIVPLHLPEAAAGIGMLPGSQTQTLNAISTAPGAASVATNMGSDFANGNLAQGLVDSLNLYLPALALANATDQANQTDVSAGLEAEIPGR